MAKRREWSGTVERYIRKVTVRGREVYSVQIGGRGKGNRKSKLCATLADAVEVKRAWLAGEQAVEDPGPESDPDVEDALAHHALHLRRTGRLTTARCEEYQIRAMRRTVPALLAVPVAGVTAAHFEDYVQRRRAVNIRDNSIVRELRLLRAAIKRVRPDFKVPESVFPPENLTRVRVLTPEQRGRIFSAIAHGKKGGPHFARMAELAMLTVTRQNDLRTLTRDMVHLHERLLLLPRTKGGAPRQVRLSAPAVAILKAQLASHEHEVVFARPKDGRPYSGRHIHTVWSRFARQHGLRGFTFHDLRHHVPTIAVNDGANPQTIQALGGWKTYKAAARYATVMAATVDHYLDLAAAEG